MKSTSTSLNLGTCLILQKSSQMIRCGRTPDGIGTHWVMQEFHYKDADTVYQRPFVLCRLKNKSDDGDEPSPSQLASNSGNFIVPQENHELSLDLQPFFNNDERMWVRGGDLGVCKCQAILRSQNWE
ncbi:hypothetical protein Q3G72_029957 [Acer saccharum]|nr:hypothetical protein Q3G72_029957 [Acer saccharum]